MTQIQPVKNFTFQHYFKNNVSSSRTPYAKSQMNTKKIEVLSVSVKFCSTRHLLILYFWQFFFISSFGNINTSIILYTKLLIDTLLNISVLPFRNRVVKSIFVFFWMESDLILAEYCSSKSIRLLVF